MVIPASPFAPRSGLLPMNIRSTTLYNEFTIMPDDSRYGESGQKRGDFFVSSGFSFSIIQGPPQFLEINPIHIFNHAFQYGIYGFFGFFTQSSVRISLQRCSCPKTCFLLDSPFSVRRILLKRLSLPSFCLVTRPLSIRD